MGHGTSRFRLRNGTGPRRATNWFSGPRGVLAFSTNVNALFPTAVTNFGDGQTIIRIRGELIVSLSGGSALEGFTRCAAGICIVSDNAAGIGVSAVPAPVDDNTWEGWMWHWSGGFQMAGADFTSANGTQALRLPIDNKAMRKIGEDETLVAMFQTKEEVGTAVLGAILNTRCLQKLA